MWFWILFVYVLLILVVFNAKYILPIYNFKRKYDFAKTIPGPEFKEVVANAKEDRILLWLKSLRKKYGPIFRVWLGKDLFVFFSDPDDIKAILTNNQLIDKSNTYKLLEPWLGRGLVTNGGEDWHRKRKLLTPAFHFKILSEFKQPMEERCDVLISKLKTEANGKSINIYPYLTLFTLDVICETAMGIKKHALEESDSQYVQAIQTMCKIFHKQTFSFFHRIPFFFRMSAAGKQQKKTLKIIHDETNRVIKLRREFLDKNNINTIKEVETKQDVGEKPRLAFLDMLLITQKEGANLTDENIREEVDTFMFAGQDTTSSALSFAIYLLSKHSDIQERAYQEVKEGQDKDQMKFLEAIIKETLRIYPSIPFFSRVLNEDLQLNDMIIPKGTGISVLVYALHHDPKEYTDPEKFNPDRYMISNPEQHPFSFVPFSAGPRNCIGQRFAMLELKTALAKILKAFEFLPVEEFEVKLMPEVTLKSRNGIEVKLKVRNG